MASKSNLIREYAKANGLATVADVEAVVFPTKPA